MHISVTKCCIVGYGTDAFWHLWDGYVYTAFTEGKDIGEMMSAFDDYALHKKYDTYLGDTVPLSCANALGINIIVLNDSRKDRLSKIIFTKKNSKVCVFVCKRDDHYDGLIPMEHICDHYEEPL